ncbi:hypothetical protein [Georgenia halophila]|uniref:DUF7927 domain-containing protein n=1 Tax=Georgenia halophila TaxID=620889 RepID=UPI0031F10ED5
MASPARAETNTAPSYGAAISTANSNTFYAYVDEGETLDLSFVLRHGAADGQQRGVEYTVTDPSGAVLWTCAQPADAQPGDTCETTGLTGAPGAWKIEVVAETGDGLTAYEWSIDVRDGGGTAVPGRVWANQYVTHQENDAAVADLRYWLVNDSGYIYDTRLNDYNGIGSVIAADAVGNVATAGGCDALYRSVQSSDAVASGECGTYRIFFDEPSADLPASAPSVDGTLTVLPPILTEDDLAVDDLAFTPDAARSAAGTFSHSISPRFVGSYWLEIDTDGDGAYVGPADRRIQLAADGSGSYDYAFDGEDGQGNAIAQCTTLNARVFYDRVGEIHVLNQDVEGRAGGISMTRLNGGGAPDSTVYWDDTQLQPGPENTTNPTPVVDGTAGVDSSAGVHGWDFSYTSWGNARTIDDWAYDPVELATGEIAISGGCLTVEKTSDAGENSQAGDVVTYTVDVTNVGDSAYTADEPATLTDDLSDVLDDASYNDDAAVTFSGGSASDAPTVADGTLTWSGPLEPGETATITYSVTLERGGDRTVTNQACIPEEQAQDPASVCVSTTTELPALEVTKTADTTELPGVGETVTYTVTGTNIGPGDYTADDPAYVFDDLTDVRDDATLDEASLAADVGDDPAYSEPVISWSGPLTAGESVTITYEVTYTGTGDFRLVNVAWEPTDPEDSETPECDPADENGLDPVTGESCGRVEIPAALLDVAKSVNPEKGTAVTTGEQLTYTITFSNSGEASAPVDGWVDDLTPVLDDAQVVSQPASADLTVSEIADGRFTVDGSVPAGESYTVTYVVEVLPDGERGDDVLANFVFPEDEVPDDPPDPQDCADDDPLCTYNPVPEIVDSKSVDPESGTTVQAGQELTYTLTFSNTGAGEGEVDRVDDLTHLLDDAEVISVPSASDDALSVSEVADGRYSITGTLEPGQTETVTYTVQVLPADEIGDHQLANFLLDPEDVTPDDPGQCEEGDEDCTYNPVSHVTVVKSSDPASGTELEDGQQVTYTLTFTNTGAATGDVDHTDHMAGVLDDAAIVSGPEASDMSFAIIDGGDEYTIQGSLEPSATVTVSYTVEVREWDEQGDHQLGNFVTVSGDEPPETCVDGSPLCTEHPVDPPPSPSPVPEGLPDTGARAVLLPLLGGLLLIGTGGTLMSLRRRGLSGQES